MTVHNPMRFGIIGFAGNIGRTHIAALKRIPDATIVGLADIDAVRGAPRAAEAGVPFFVDHRQMLRETMPDVVTVCTPHPYHPDLAIEALEMGCHVLVEKPMAIETLAADEMIAAAERAQRTLAVNFQSRLRASTEKVRELIDGGAVGPLLRVTSIEPLFRPETYFKLSTWRGTWNGEGGGVLMNQAPHPLDLLCYLAGQPKKVWGWVRTRHHHIETEDSAQAMFEFAGGAPGYLCFSTFEYGVQSRLEIAGENGVIEIVGSRVTLKRLAPSLPVFSDEATQPFSAPKVETEVFEFPDDRGNHYYVYLDLIAAIREGRAPRCYGRQGLMSLELANAITLSSHNGGQAVTMPVDRMAYRTLLRDLQAKSRVS